MREGYCAGRGAPEHPRGDETLGTLARSSAAVSLLFCSTEAVYLRPPSLSPSACYHLMEDSVDMDMDMSPLRP